MNVIMAGFVDLGNGSKLEVFSDFNGFFDCEGFVNGFNLSSRYVELDAGTDDFAQA